MATETLKEYRKMAADQLKEREAELRKELFDLRTTTATEKVKDTSKFQKIKKDIARILTIQRETEINQSEKKSEKKTGNKAKKA